MHTPLFLLLWFSAIFGPVNLVDSVEGGSPKANETNETRADGVTGEALLEERRAVHALWWETGTHGHCPSKFASSAPAMSPAEVKFAQSMLQGKVFYVEYGSGASTEWFAPLVNFTVTIENGASWCREIFERKMIKCLVHAGRLDIMCFALSDTGTWAMPTAWSNKNHTQNYHLYVRALSFVNFPRYDVVLVDGRYRVAVALYALMYIDQRTIVLIHDFNRKIYHDVLQYYDKVGMVDRLVALQKKPDLPPDALHAWRRFIHHPQ